MEADIIAAFTFVVILQLLTLRIILLCPNCRPTAEKVISND